MNLGLIRVTDISWKLCSFYGGPKNALAAFPTAEKMIYHNAKKAENVISKTLFT